MNEKPSSDFKLHDLVRVKQQPKMQNVQIKGLMAVITEIEGDYCTIHELQLDGRASGGSGAVELECLEHPKASGPWRAAHAVYKQHMLEQEAMLAEGEIEDEKARKKRKRAIKLVAEKHGLDSKKLIEIMKDLEASAVLHIYR